MTEFDKKSVITLTHVSLENHIKVSIYMLVQSSQRNDEKAGRHFLIRKD